MAQLQMEDLFRGWDPFVAGAVAEEPQLAEAKRRTNPRRTAIEIQTKLDSGRLEAVTVKLEEGRSQNLEEGEFEAV